MERRQLIQHMDKASRIAVAFDDLVRAKAPREAIAVFQEIFDEREMNDRDGRNHAYERYLALADPSLVFLDSFHIRRVRLWCERRSIGTANNLPMTGMGFIPEEVWEKLRQLPAGRGSPPIVWLALTQREKESYLDTQ